jgi:hypothetical protein
MSTVQLAIIDSTDTSIALALPGVQGPAGIAANAITVTGVSYSLSSINNNRLALFAAASGTIATIPSGLPDGFNCLAVQTTASGQVTISGASGVTLRSSLGGRRTAYQWAVASIIKIGIDEYLLTGEIAT